MKTKPSSPYINPLDELFETAQETPVVEYDQVTQGELAALQSENASPDADADDTEIDKKIDQVYDAAYDTFQNQMAYTEIVEPRYAARNAEVAANYLSIALNAAAARARVKSDRKRNSTFVPYGAKPGSGAIVASREDIMRMMSVDGETKEIK